MPEDFNDILSSEMVKVLTKMRRKDTIASWLLDLNDVARLNMRDNLAYPRSAICDATGQTLFVIPVGKPPTTARTIIKHGRWVNTLAEKEGVEFYGRDVEIFVQLLKATIAPPPDDKTLEVISGDDIMRYYHEDRYDKNHSLGTLGNSCMRQGAKQRLIQFYAANPHRIKMLILRSPSDKNKIIGRALLWDTNKGMFMDRVYSDNEQQPKFIQYAERNGYWYCDSQQQGEKTLLKEGAASTNSKAFMVTDLTFPEGRGIRLPYMDTLFHAYRDLGILAGKSAAFKYGYLGKAQDQNGGIDVHDESYVICNYYGGIRMPSSGCTVGFSSYKNMIDGIADNFPKEVTFHDTSIDEHFHVNNMVIGLDGDKYVVDNPNIKWLTGETYKLPVKNINAFQCITDGLWYYRQFHTVKTYVLKCKGKEHVVNIRDHKVKEFFEKYAVDFNPDISMIEINSTFQEFLNKINVKYEHI